MEPQPTPTEDRMRRCTYQSAFERPLKRQRQIAPSSIFDHLPLSENRPYTPFDPLPQGGCAPLIPADLTISQYRVRISSLVSCPSYSVTLPQLDIPPRTQGASPSSAPATVANNAGTQSSTSPATSSVGIPGNNGSKLSEHLLGGNSKISTSPSRRAHLLSNDMELKRRHTPQPVVNSKQKLIPCPYELCQKTFSRNSNLKVHMRIHTKTYPFACNLCEREFMWSSSLHWHTKWHEKVALREAAKSKASAKNNLGTGLQKNESCTCTCVCPVHKGDEKIDWVKNRNEREGKLVEHSKNS